MKQMRSIAIESLVSGTVGAFAMMPAGALFRLLQMRVGHYGPKFAELYMSAPDPFALFVQHLVLGWISAVPLALLPLHRVAFGAVCLAGIAYGALYYVAVNSLALPLYFGDSLLWVMGWQVVLPSLVVHIVFGLAVACSIRIFRRKFSAA